MCPRGAISCNSLACTSSCCTPRAVRCGGSKCPGSKRPAPATDGTGLSVVGLAVAVGPGRGAGAGRLAGLALGRGAGVGGGGEGGGWVGRGGGEPLWWLQLASMAMLAWLLRPGADRAVAWHRAALIGGVFATAWLAGTFWWLFISMHRYGALPAPLAAAAVLVLAAFLASYYAAAMGLFCLLAPLHRAGAALLFGACGLLAELARGSLWTGFPWGAGGYAHADGPLRVLARYVGVYGIGAVAALLALLCVQWRRADLRHWPVWLLLLAGAAALALAAVQRTCAIDLCDTPPPRRRDPTLSVELLQGNIAQDEKFRQGSGVALALQWYGQALRTARAQLVVAPETALPLLP